MGLEELTANEEVITEGEFMAAALWQELDEPALGEKEQSIWQGYLQKASNEGEVGFETAGSGPDSSLTLFSEIEGTDFLPGLAVLIRPTQAVADLRVGQENCPKLTARRRTAVRAAGSCAGGSTHISFHRMRQTRWLSN